MTPGDRAILSSKHWLAERHGTDAEILEIDLMAGERNHRVQLPSGIKIWVTPKDLTPSSDGSSRCCTARPSGVKDGTNEQAAVSMKGET